MNAFEFQPLTRVIFGPGTISRLGEAARGLGFSRTLLVADAGMRDCGHYGRAREVLEREGIAVFGFHEFDANPDTAMVEAGKVYAAPLGIDSIIGLGGGSSLDCAKGINFVLTNGGTMRDYWGHGKAHRPMLPMIGVPTTGGTGSEAQTYALISDAETHVKMACGDEKAAFRIALLDPELAVSAPFGVRATAGYDAISHAVETAVTAKRNPVSEGFARQAWRLLEPNFERVLQDRNDVEAMGQMLIGSFLAGLAIENSMLGATHACANPLTARYGTTHGAAIALLLAHVVRWNTPVVGGVYRELHASLAERLEALAEAANLETRLGAVGVPHEDLPQLAEAAALQWTGKFNPRPFDAAGAREVYECAY